MKLSTAESGFNPEALVACTIKRRDELPASSLIQYQAFVDPSGGKADSFTVAIGHKENGKAIVDLARAWQPPFDPLITVHLAREANVYLGGNKYLAQSKSNPLAQTGLHRRE